MAARCAHRLNSFRIKGWRLVAVIFLALPPLRLQSQQANDSATVKGTVHDTENKPIAGATVSLQASDEVQPLTTHSDAQGNYVFASLRAGTYALRAEKAGCGRAAIPSLSVGPKEAKNVDLTLAPDRPAALPSTSSRLPDFFDEPQFTVSGVTDTTNLGGHASDTIVRTRDAIAKETASLGKASLGSESAVRTATPAATPDTKEDTLRTTLQREPDSFAANRDLGKMLIEKGRARDAIPYLARAAELNPADYDSAYNLALANAEAGNYDSARVRAQALLAQHDKAELRHLLADVQEKLGNSLEAVREYQRAAELDPSEPNLFDWGSELLLHRAPEPALEVFAKGNRLYPRSVRMLLGLGAAWFTRGSYDEAVQRICEASDLTPDDSAPYRFLGRIESEQSVPSDELVERLRRFVTLQPENAEASYYYAVGLWKRRATLPDSSKDAAGAAQVESLLNHAVQLNPKFGAAYLQLGILHADQGDTAKAISDYQQAIQASPQMAEAHYRLAQAYRRNGEADKAKTELQLYGRTEKETAQRVERERHEIRQFVYTLRSQPPVQPQ
jgi:tetratricopeptide (TPR) repeat protein